MTKNNNNNLDWVQEHTKIYAEFSIKLKLLALALLFCIGSYIDTRKRNFVKSDEIGNFQKHLHRKLHRKHHSKKTNPHKNETDIPIPQNISQVSSQIKLCPGTKYITDLNHQRHIQLSFENLHSYSQISEKYQKDFKNATYSPPDCYSRFKIAILIAFRNRDKHLKNMLPYLIEILQKQKLSFKIFIVEQTKDTIFNRGKLLNVGYKMVKLEEESFDCIVFHDVDMIAVDERLSYSCDISQPKFMASKRWIRDRWGKEKRLSQSFGAVSSLTVRMFEKLNGYSNMYRKV